MHQAPPATAALRGLLLALACAGAMLGCKPAEPGLPGVSAGVRDAGLWQELESIERYSRAKPRELEQRLQALQARTAPGSAERLELLSLRGRMAALLRDRVLIDELLGQLQHWPAESGRAAAELAATTTLAQYQLSRGDVREAMKAMQARGQATPAQTPVAPLPALLRLRAQATLATIQVQRGEVEAAMVAAQEALRLAESLDSHWRRALALAELARVHMQAQQSERAEQAVTEAQREARLDPDPVTLNVVATMRGIVHANDLDSQVSQQAWTEAIDHARESGAESLLAQSQANYADYFLRRGDFARAQALAEQALPLARRSQNLNAEIVALSNMGLAKIGQKRIEEGKRDARLAITLDEQQGSLAYVADSWQELGQYLESAGDWAGAIDAHHRYRSLSDQVLRDDTRKTLLEAQERYDAERRAKEIELLNRDNSLKAEQIRAHDLQLRLWGAVAGCVVLSAFLLGLAYQRIRRTNAALASSNASLKLQSECDPLTGLANRRHFQSAVTRLAAEGKLAGTVYLIDIDHFKRINDQHGHAAGDSVLVEVARRLRSALREDDLVVRWGGEEFLIVVPPRLSGDAQALAQRLLNTVAQLPVLHGERSITVSASIGFASFPVAPHGLALSWERAIDLVDTVMYLAKAHGRNKAYGVLYVDAVDEAALGRLAQRLEAAWQEGRVGLVALQGPSPAEGAT